MQDLGYINAADVRRLIRQIYRLRGLTTSILWALDLWELTFGARI